VTTITHEGEFLRLLALALDYPSGDTVVVCQELATRARAERPQAADGYEEFASVAGALADYRLRELYAETFDWNPACCLYVGFHLFGESYKRGAFMAKLNGEYRTRGFSAGNELPDHLCVMLRYLADVEDDEVALWLTDEAIAPALRKIAKAFDDSDSIYGTLMQAAFATFERVGQGEHKPADRTLPVLDVLASPYGELEP
jgi:nitrate reductase delta subunit